jgi:CDP-glucose 4,6-dehydratase
MPVAITRAGNFFGPGDLNWSRLIPGTIRSVLRERPPVIRSDGSPLRDYVYVEDAAEAYVVLGEAVLDGRAARGAAFNISCGRPLSARQVVDAILEVTGSGLQPVVENSARHEILHQYLDATRFRETTGWTPQHSFEDGLRRTVDWYRGRLAEREHATA